MEIQHKIKITVEGETGSGKTALCQLIHEALNSYGIRNHVPEVLDERTHRAEYRAHKDLLKVLVNLSQRGEVEIIEKNTPHHG